MQTTTNYFMPPYLPPPMAHPVYHPPTAEYLEWQQEYFEKQKKRKADPNFEAKCAQYVNQQSYLKCSPEQKTQCRIFADLPIENEHDASAQAFARSEGLGPELQAGKLSNAVR